MRCPFSDMVVSQGLDGWGLDGPLPEGAEPGRESGEASDEARAAWLVEHARGCPTCQRALDDSRRLDAAIATMSVGAADRPSGERALAAALTRVREERVTSMERLGSDAEPTGRRASPLRLTLGAAACVAAGFALAWNALAHRPAPAPAIARSPDTDRIAGRLPADVDAASPNLPHPPHTAPSDPTTGTDSVRPGSQLAIDREPSPTATGIGLFAIPVGGGESARGLERTIPPRESRSLLVDDLVLRTADDVDGALALLRSTNLQRRLAASQQRMRWLVAGPLASPPPTPDADRADLEQLTRGTRVRLATALARSTREDAHTGWIELLPALEPTVRDQAMEAGRAAETMRRTVALMVRQGQPHGLRAAAWLGGADLDDSLRRQLRRDPSATAEVLTALALPGHRPGRTPLAIDLWREAIVRGALDDSLATARRFFAEFGPEVSRELLSLAREGRNLERRELAMLALAGRADRTTRDELRELMDGEHRGIALLAALALGQLPADDLAIYERRAREPRQVLLRTVLASAGSPASARWLEQMHLSDVERELLAAGRFDRTHFEWAVTLFRERTVTDY